tara:strand:+ start:23 stop:505 length:483 start_codon:yes stop_codon:yes gene_type:complete
MSGVLKNTQNFFYLDSNFLNKIKSEYRNSEKKISRLLLHNSPKDNVQEMIICFGKDTKIYPNCSKGKSESLNVLEGKMKLINFDNNGNVTKKLNMEPLGSSVNPFLYRFNKCEWHTMVAISDLVLVHEILEGPFNNMKNLNPKWVPNTNESLTKFYKKIL